MSLISLPNELLREIVLYLRPYNKYEPIVGLNAAWKPLSTFRKSLNSKARPSPVDGERRKEEEGNQPEEEYIYSTVIALRSYVVSSL
jgi:hypothetical protein